MITEILTSYELVLQDVRRMIAELSEEQMVALPIEGMNHPAWIVGHLVFSCQMMGGEVGIKPWLPEEWPGLFATGTVAEGAVSDQRSAVSEKGTGGKAETLRENVETSKRRNIEMERRGKAETPKAESRKEEDGRRTESRAGDRGAVERSADDRRLTQRRGDAEKDAWVGYPGKAELMAALEDGRNRLVAVLTGMTDEELNAPLPDVGCRKTLPTIGVALMHILIGHTALHAGQLSAWRRAMGLGTAG